MLESSVGIILFALYIESNYAITFESLPMLT